MSRERRKAPSRGPGPSETAESARDALDHGLVECAAEHPLRGALSIEVGRCTAVDERPAGTQDEAQVDVLDLGDHALVEHEPDLLREAVLHAPQDLGLTHRG